MDALGLLSLIQSSSGSSFQILSTDSVTIYDSSEIRPPSGATAFIFLAWYTEVTLVTLYTMCTAGGAATLAYGINGNQHADFDWSAAKISASAGSSSVRGTLIWLK